MRFLAQSASCGAACIEVIEVAVEAAAHGCCVAQKRQLDCGCFLVFAGGAVIQNLGLLGVLRRSGAELRRRCVPVGWRGGAAAYEGTGVDVRGRARRRRAVEARGGRFGCFWRCPHGRRLGKATPGLVRLGMQQRASSSGPFSFVANVVALRLRCRDMPSWPVFREPFPRRRGTSLPERRVWRTLPSLSNLHLRGCRACNGSVGEFEATDPTRMAAALG